MKSINLIVEGSGFAGNVMPDPDRLGPVLCHIRKIKGWRMEYIY